MFAFVACDQDGWGRPATGACDACSLAAPEVELTPAAPLALEPLYAAVTVAPTSLDGSVVTYTWTWTRDGVALAELAGVDRVPADWTRTGETWAVEVEARSEGARSDPATAEVAISARPPDVSVTLSPTAPGTDDALTCFADTLDPEGGAVAVTWAWIVDGAARAELVAAEAPAAETARDEEWTCVATATTLHDASASATAAVIIGNSAPSVVGAVISPSVPTPETGATCAGVGYSDPDGDPAALQYAWWRTDTTLDETGPELSGTLLAPGDLLVCSVTASDGEAAGNTVASAAVEVGVQD